MNSNRFHFSVSNSAGAKEAQWKFRRLFQHVARMPSGSAEGKRT
jgi:hypothetical protein